MMASLLARPLALHEQNAIAGLANRVLAGVSDKVLVAFPRRPERPSGRQPGAGPDTPHMAPPEQRYARREGADRLLVVAAASARKR